MKAREQHQVKGVRSFFQKASRGFPPGPGAAHRPEEKVPEALWFLTRQPRLADGLQVSRGFKGKKEIFIFYQMSRILNIGNEFKI